MRTERWIVIHPTRYGVDCCDWLVDQALGSAGLCEVVAAVCEAGTRRVSNTIFQDRNISTSITSINLYV